MNKVKISDYFKYNISAQSGRDWDKIQKIRRKINSFEDEYDIYRWLDDRRRSSYAREEDYRLFSIPKNSEVDIYASRKRNIYHQEYEENKYDKEYGIDNYKKNKDGSYETDVLGNKVKNNALKRISINIANNIINSRYFKMGRLLIANAKAIIIAIIAFVLVLTISVASVYGFGIANSIGKSPFALCGSDGYAVDGVTLDINSQDLLEIMTPEYASNIFVMKARERGWKENAIIGVLSYILQEGTGMGTFTYEGHYTYTGPSGVIDDILLDNDRWRDWLSGSGKEQAHNLYYKDKNWYASIGLGLLQNSDVWRKDGVTMDAKGATALLDYADSMGGPWQDPEIQLNFFFDTQFNKPTAFDSRGVDPTKDNRSPEEWTRRISAGIGMPSMKWTDENDYMKDHIRHIDEATAIVNSFTAGSIKSFSAIYGKRACNSSISGMLSAGNQSIADAAVSIASGDGISISWDEDGSSSEKLNDERLKLYKELKSLLYPNDIYFASCDRAVASAVRWAGADDTFPMGDTAILYNYLKSSTKWSYVGEFEDLNKMRPGDILITHGKGHIKIFTGNEAIQKRFPGSESNMFAASFQEYFPYVYKDYPGYDKKPYSVFRNVTPEANSKYTSILK